MLKFYPNGVTQVVGIKKIHHELESWTDEDVEATVVDTNVLPETEPNRTEPNETELGVDMPPGLKRLEESFDKEYTGTEISERDSLPKRIAIFIYFWEFAFEHKPVISRKDSDKIREMVIDPDNFRDVLYYIPWFVLYEKGDWLKDQDLLRTITGLSLSVNKYHKIQRKGDKWENVKQKVRDTTEALKKERPRPHEYLMKLKR